MRETKKARPSDVATAVVFAAVLFLLCILTFILPQRDFSENENRPLTTLGSLTAGGAKAVFDGSFESAAGDFFRDQFPLREGMLKLRSLSDVLTLRMETADVMYGKDGYQIPRPDQSCAAAKGNLDAIEELRAALEKDGKALVFAVAPRPADALYPYYPAGYDGSDLERGRKAVFDGCSYAVDLLGALSPSIDAGEYVWYRTDHHWTTKGAYLAACAILSEFGKELPGMEYFKVETASGEFYGTTYSKTMSPLTESDVIEYYRYGGDGDFVTEIVDTGETFEGFYDRSYLEKKDKYSSFFGGNNARVRVTKKGGEERQTLLVIKDSYAHAVMPFLAMYYDLDVVDPRYYTSSVYRLSQEDGCFAVLILCGVDTVTENQSLARVRFGTGG